MRGFTLIEILVVTATLAVVLGISLPFVLSSKFKTDINVTADNLISMLKEAQSLAVAGEGDTPYGVYFDTTAKTYTIFRGASYASRDTAYNAGNYNIFSLPPSAEFLSDTSASAVTNLSSKLPGSWSGLDLSALVQDPSGNVYVGGTQAKLGRYNPTTDTFTDLSSKIASFWTLDGTPTGALRGISALTFDTVNNTLYIGGGRPTPSLDALFASCNVSSCMNGVSNADNLTSKIVPHFSGGGGFSGVNSTVFDPIDQVVYIGGSTGANARLAKCPVGPGKCSDVAASGVKADDLTPKLVTSPSYTFIDASYSNGTPIRSLALDIAGRVLYVGGGGYGTDSVGFAKCPIGTGQCADVTSGSLAIKLTARIDPVWTDSPVHVRSMVFNSQSRELYLGGASGAGGGYEGFAKCDVGCLNNTSDAISINSKINSIWGATVPLVQAMSFNPLSGALYVAGGTDGSSMRVAKCDAASCINGASNATNLSAIFPFWSSTNSIKAMASCALYIAGQGGNFAKYDVLPQEIIFSRLTGKPLNSCGGDIKVTLTAADVGSKTITLTPDGLIY